MLHRDARHGAILTLTLLVLLWSGAVAARAECECPTMPTVDEAFGGATAVFEGTAVAQIPTIIWYAPGNGEQRLLPTQKVRFRVDRVWKGRVGPEITILEGSDECSFWFQAGGGKQLVFATPHESEPGWLGVHKCAQPWGIGSKNKLIIDALGAPKMTYNGGAPPTLGWLSQAVQNASVYFVTGVASLYSQALGDIPLQEPWRWLPALEALLVLSLIGAVIMIRRRFSRATALALAVLVIVIYAAVLATATGAVVVHQSDSWLQHLLEGWAAVANPSLS